VKFGPYTFHSQLQTSAAFLTKYSNSGDVLWAKVMSPIPSNPGRNTLYGITVDTGGNVWICGQLGSHGVGSMSLNNSTVLYPPTTTSPFATSPSFFVQYSSVGDLMHYEALPIGGDDDGLNLTSDWLGNVYLGGDIEIDPFILGNDTLHLYNSSSEAMFLAKYGTNYLVQVTQPENRMPELSLYPNPASDEITISASIPIAKISVSNMLGQMLFSTTCNTTKETINISILPPGMYLVKVNDVYVRRVVKE
jgi:hypothetical protein